MWYKEEARSLTYQSFGFYSPKHGKVHYLTKGFTYHHDIRANVSEPVKILGKKAPIWEAICARHFRNCKWCKMKMDTMAILAIDYFPPLESPPHFVIDYAYFLHYTLHVSLDFLIVWQLHACITCVLIKALSNPSLTVPALSNSRFPHIMSFFFEIHWIY